VKVGLGDWWSAQSSLAGPLSALIALAEPDKRGRIGIPASDGVVEPGDQLLLGLGMLSVEGTADDDALDRLGQVQPGAANRSVERHDAMLEQPTDDGPTVVAGQVVPDQEEAERGQRVARLVAEPGRPAGQGWARALGDGDRWERVEHRGELSLQPGVEHGVGRGWHSCGPDLAGCRSEQRQQFGRPAPYVLVGQAGRLADRRPGDPRLRDRLVRTGLVLAPDRQAGRFG
jgi:hypothetical protein